MSKKYKGKTCIYCGVADISDTGDHVLAKEFTLKRHRHSLPKVPACHACNNAKSRLEHYLTVVLPYAAKHEDAHENLVTMVPNRLDHNPALQRSIEQTLIPRWIPSLSGLITKTSTVLVDAEILNSWAAMVVQGLIWHHWQVVADPARYDVEVLHLHESGAAYFSYIFKTKGKPVTETTIGGGALTYQAQGVSDHLPASTWRLVFYGGIELGGDDPRVRTREAYVAVTPKERIAPAA
jgi:hypothetical protein